jgi:nucleoside-diphosphate-sugar epimerase
MANYLVTGAAGFIGARVCELLLEANHTVTGVDNLNNAYDVRMKEYRLKRLLVQPGFRFLRADISQRETMQALIPQVPYAAVINLAARAGVRQSLDNPWLYMDTNITGSLNMLEFCRSQRIPKFIQASTSSVYGENAPLPTPESASSDFPLQVYAASKKGAEALCHVYHYLYGLDVTVCRYFTVYGPAPRPDMVMFRFTQWISEGRQVRVNGDGEQSRGFTYVDDIARGTLLALKPLGYEIINLGGSQSITINALLRVLENLIGRRANITYLPRHPADMNTNLANIEKARDLLGWEPRVSLQDGIEQLVAWYRTEREWAAQIDTA